MSTIREQIMANRHTALQALLYDDAHQSRPFLVVDRVKAGFYEPNQYPALYIFPAKETKVREGLQYVCELQIILEASVKLDNTNADTALNALLEQIQTTMTAEPSCGSRAQLLFEKENDFAVGISAASGAADRAVIISTWIVKYRHHATDPTKNA